MAKFARTGFPIPTTAAPLPAGPVTTTGPQVTNHQGGTGWARDPKSDLFLFAAVNMVGEDTFYEKAAQRDERFRTLVHQATMEDPAWVARFVPYLRNEMHMRSASVVMAVESALARLGRIPGVAVDAAQLADAPTVRQLIASALTRADEPAELIAYWRARTGKRSIPGGVQRGLADAVTRLFTEKAALKYDGINRSWRMADVIAVAKPKPSGAWQADLFDFLADKRWNRPEVRVSSRLSTVGNWATTKELDTAERRATLINNPDVARKSGITWEEMSSLGKMDKAAWEAMIPSMGYMALLRNLRNFDEAGVSDDAAALVMRKLANPTEVARSRQFPYRFLSAYRAAPSLRWGHPLEQAMQASAKQIPQLPGRTLIMIDTSGSMHGNVSAKSEIRHVDVGALIGLALAFGMSNVDIVGYATGWFRFIPTKGGSLLKDLDMFCAQIGRVGHGTNTMATLNAAYDKHDRVIIVTDGQAFADNSGGYGHWDVMGRLVRPSVSTSIPAEVPMFGINTTGYAVSSIDTSQPNRFEIGGFSDKVFQLFSLLATGQGSDWPF
jgi:hypothetical protein